eukprot:TRINITY_DN9228_c0_g1_i2.p1 TRINITY_DN9228_c0_g1~~TRINITY_DN9228_c0_g1_i2.p1  ORF type:complete len:649 (-),score=77.12 TRINITY_DN9228_c0_g1_i2:76-1974(-)
MARQMMINPEQRTLLHCVQHIDDYPESPGGLDLSSWDDVRILDLVNKGDVADWAMDLVQRWGTAKHRLRLAMRKLKECYGPENQLSSEKLKAMEEMRRLGGRLTPQQFVVALTVLNQEKAIEFLRSMSFELNKDEWSEWCHLKNEGNPRETVAPYRMLDNKINWPWPLHKDRSWQSWFSTFRTAIFGGKLAGKTIAVHWMPATQILNPDPEDHSDAIRIMSALQNIGSEGGAFVTPVGWSILNRTWRANYGDFRRARLVDAAYIIMLGVISYHCVHGTKYADGQEIPPEPVSLALVVIAILLTLRNIVRQCAEFLGCFLEFQHLDEAVVQTCTLWNTFLFLLEVSTAFNMCQLLDREVRCYVDGFNSANCSNSSSFYTMPVRYSLVVGTKWISFIMALLCFDVANFGRSVFPALHAITRMESLAFMATLMLSVIGAFHTYTAFPIAENVKVSEWFAFMKVFQFALLGNFDVWDLEGVDPEIKGSVSHTNFSGSVDDGPVSKKYHDGVMIFVMFLGITVTILSMNVAIGVVSDLYSQAKSNSLQIHSHYKAGYLFRLQLQSHVMGWTKHLDVCCPLEDEEVKDPDCFLCSVVAADVPGDYSDGDTGLETLEKRILESLISKLHLQLSNNARLG